MKKMLALFLGVVLLCPILFTGCENSSFTYIAVDEVVWAKKEIELMPGEYFDLDYKVYPTNATNRSIKLIDADRSAFTTNLTWNINSVLIDFVIIDEDTIQILDFNDQSELKLNINYKSGEEEEDRVATCKIKKREVPSAIHFENIDYYMSTGQTLKLSVFDNWNNELDLSKYKVTFTVDETDKNKLTVLDAGKGIVQAVSAGALNLKLKIDFVLAQDSDGNVSYKTLDTTCRINITDSYDKVQIFTEDLVLANDGDVKTISSTGTIYFRFLQNNYSINLTNCEFEVQVVAGFNYSAFEVLRGVNQFELKINSIPLSSQYILVKSTINDKTGSSYSQLFKVN